MRFFRKIAGFLGLVKDDGGHEVRDQEDDDQHHHHHNHNQTHPRSNFQETGLPRRGFSVPVKVAVERPQQGPVIIPCTSGDGGVQGLRWYAKRLKVDEDGDVADEFIEEILPQTASSADDTHKPFPKFADDTHKPSPKFAARYSARPARIKKQVLTQDGKFQQCIEHQGRLQWV